MSNPYRKETWKRDPLSHIQITPNISLRRDYIKKVTFEPGVVVVTCMDGWRYIITPKQGFEVLEVL